MRMFYFSFQAFLIMSELLWNCKEQHKKILRTSEFIYYFFLCRQVSQACPGLSLPEAESGESFLQCGGSRAGSEPTVSYLLALGGKDCLTPKLL